MSEDHLNFAKHQILLYVESMFLPICFLGYSPDYLAELMNAEPHGLSREEVISALEEMFQDYQLVAMRNDRNLFTPTREEIAAALKQGPFTRQPSLATLSFVPYRSHFQEWAASSSCPSGLYREFRAIRIPYYDPSFHTYYGLTSGGIDFYQELQAMYSSPNNSFKADK